MKQRQCPKCGILVEVTKAFCPDCGGAMVAEQKREVAPEFDLQAKTVQYSNSVFGMIIKDMDLDISGESDSGEQKKQAISPPAEEKIERKGTDEPAKEPKISKTAIWLIAGGVVVLFVLIISILAIAGVLLYMR